MASDIIEPPVGPSGADPVHPRPDHAHPLGRPAPIPADAPSSSSSGDELTASLTQANPDPMLGEFSSRSGSGETPFAREAVSGEPPAVPPDGSQAAAPGGDKTAQADVLQALGTLHLDGDPAAPISVSSSDVIAGLDLNASAAPGAPDGHDRRPEPAPSPEEDDEDDDLTPHGTSWATLLLASYASAVTLGLFWVLWTGRRIRDDAPEVSPPAETRPDPGLRANKSRNVIPPKPIADEYLAALGQMVRLGQIEATPLGLTSGPVKLERNFNRRETKAGGKDALRLRLRLRNVSKDVILAPFDEAFVRDRLGDEPDSMIETGADRPAIAMYPLAVESEWAIVGQRFHELKPGEEFETEVVSVADAVSKMAPEMTWRVRLRTDINHTDDFGVRFRPEDVKPARPGK